MAKRSGHDGNISPHTRKELKLEERKSAKLRVATYNVLSDALCSPSTYTRSDPDHIDNMARFNRVKVKLTEEAELGTILCLQVS